MCVHYTNMCQQHQWLWAGWVSQQQAPVTVCTTTPTVLVSAAVAETWMWKTKIGSDSVFKTRTIQKFDIRSDGFPRETVCNPQFKFTHSLTSRPSSMRVGDSRRPLRYLSSLCARSCDISFSWMYLQPVHCSMSCIHCLLSLPWCRSPSMIPSRTVSANCPALPRVIWPKYCSLICSLIQIKSNKNNCTCICADKDDTQCDCYSLLTTVTKSGVCTVHST